MRPKSREKFTFSPPSHTYSPGLMYMHYRKYFYFAYAHCFLGATPAEMSQTKLSDRPWSQMSPSPISIYDIGEGIGGSRD